MSESVELNGTVKATGIKAKSNRFEVKDIFAIVNNTRTHFIIHDLKETPESAPLELAAPVGGQPPTVYYIKDMFPEAKIRASQGLRSAIRNGFVKVLTEEQVKEVEGMVYAETLRDKVEAVCGEKMKTRQGGGQQLSPEVVQALSQQISQKNEFDERYEKVKAAAKNNNMVK